MKKIILIIVWIFITQIAISQDCLNVKFKLRGYFYAGTSQVDSLAPRGFAVDQNSPKITVKKINRFSRDKKFQIVVKSDSVSEFTKGVKGFKVFVINRTDSLVGLPAQDSRLYLKRQVFHDGKWKDIEYLPSSWCGNSYHTVFIKPNEYWDFNVPCLTGKIEAKFRFELLVNENLIIHSNEFKGSFNKKQLKKEQGHNPLGIMDPYNN